MALLFSDCMNPSLILILAYVAVYKLDLLKASTALSNSKQLPILESQHEFSALTIKLKRYIC